FSGFFIRKRLGFFYSWLSFNFFLFSFFRRGFGYFFGVGLSFRFFHFFRRSLSRSFLSFFFRYLFLIAFSFAFRSNFLFAFTISTFNAGCRSSSRYNFFHFAILIIFLFSLNHI